MTDAMKKNIICMIQKGIKQAEICRIFGIGKSTVSKFLKRFRARKTVENKKQSGRPKLLTVRGKNALSVIVKKGRRKSLCEITSELNEVSPVKVSRRTVQRELHAADYFKRTVAKKLGVKEVNRKKRLQYCRGKLYWSFERYWKCVIFSDEMTIGVRPDGKVKVWRKSVEKWKGYCLGYLSQGPSQTLKLMVWGTITYYGTGILTFVDGNMDSAKYINVLDNYLWPVVLKYFPQGRWYFMDDNCPIHRSRATSLSVPQEFPHFSGPHRAQI